MSRPTEYDVCWCDEMGPANCPIHGDASSVEPATPEPQNGTNTSANFTESARMQATPEPICDYCKQIHTDAFACPTLISDLVTGQYEANARREHDEAE